MWSRMSSSKGSCMTYFLHVRAAAEDACKHAYNLHRMTVCPVCIYHTLGKGPADVKHQAYPAPRCIVHVQATLLLESGAVKHPAVRMQYSITIHATLACL